MIGESVLHVDMSRSPLVVRETRHLPMSSAYRADSRLASNQPDRR
jgi:hypothetical protein